VGQCHNCFQKYIDYLTEDLVAATMGTGGTLIDTFKHNDSYALGLFTPKKSYFRKKDENPK
jgi:hypothetical protein